MKTYLKQLNKFAIVIAIGIFLGIYAFGQQSGKLAQMQQQNGKILREYTWKARTEIKKGGETKVVRLDQVRYAVDGSLQQTQLSLTAPEIPTGGLRGKIAKKKKEQFNELIEGLKTSVQSYGMLQPDKMQRLMENGSITLEDTALGKLLRLSGADILQAGDSVTIWIDPLDQKQRRIEVRTTFEGKPVRVVSEFKQITSGPTYVARVTIQYPDQELLITTDNFDHVRDQTIGGGRAR